MSRIVGAGGIWESAKGVRLHSYLGVEEVSDTDGGGG